MTTEYIHRVTIAVPEALIEKSNHLACIVGEFSADISTFREANWQDADGNLYSIASTVVKPIFLQATQGLPETPLHAEGIADRELAQQALDNLIFYEDGGELVEGKIMLAIDHEPLKFFTDIGLTQIASDDI